MPIIKYTFDLNAATDTIVTNKGSLGTAYNCHMNSVRLTKNIEIITDANPPTGSNCLQISCYDSSGFMIIPLLPFCTNSWAICFYYKYHH